MDRTSGIEEMLAHTLRRADIQTMRRPIELPPSMAETIRRAHCEVDAMMEMLGDDEPHVATLREYVVEVERLRLRSRQCSCA